MAKTPLEKLNSRYGVKSSSKTKSTKEELESQLSNYKTRLQAAGQDDPTDTRNWFEKLTNLEQDQNVLFDIFELIGRPQQAIYGAIDAATNNEDILEGAWEGFKGDRKLTGKELLTENFGWEDSDFNLLDPSSWGEMKPSDLVGFAADIFADPADIPLIALNVASGGATTPLTVAKFGADALDTAGDLSKVAKVADKTMDTVNTAKKGLKIGKYDVALTPFKKGAMSLSELPFRGAGALIKKGAKLTDSGVTKVLGKWDDFNNNKIQKHAALNNISLEDAAKDLKRTTGRLDTYKALKKDISDAVNNAKNVLGFVGRSRQIDEAKAFDKLMGEAKSDEISKLIDDIVKKSDGALDHDTVSEKLVNAIQSEKDWSLKGQDVINRLVEGKGTANLVTREQAEDVMKVLDQFGIKSKIIDDDLGDVEEFLRVLKDEDIELTKDDLLDNIGVQLSLNNKNLKDLYSIQDALFDPITKQVNNDLNSENIKTFKELVFGSKNIKSVNDQLKIDREFFKQTPELENLYKVSQNAVKDFATNVSDVTQGLDAGRAATTDYVKASRTEDLKRTPDKSFKSTEANLDASILQNNRAKRQETLNNIVKKSKKRDAYYKDIYLQDDDGYFITKNGELVKSPKNVKEGDSLIRNNAKYDEIVTRLENRKTSISRSLDAIEKVTEVRTTGVIKGFENLPKKYQNQINDYKKLLELETKEIIKTLDNVGDITPEILEYFDEVDDALKGFSKEAQNMKKLVNNKSRALTKYADDAEEFLGKLPSEKAGVDAEFKQLKQRGKDVATALTRTKNATSKALRNDIKEIGKAFEKGKEAGEKALKAVQDIKNKAKKIDLAKMANADLQVTLTQKSNLVNEKLKKVKSADEIFADVEGKIKREVEQLEILKSKQGQNFFKNKFEETFDDYVRGAIEQNASTKKFYDALATGIFENEDYIKVYNKTDEVPHGFRVMNGNKLIDKFDSYKPIMSDDGKAFGDILQKFKDKDILIDSQFATALNIASKRGDEVKPLLKLYDTLNNGFKRFSTLTLGFHARNIIGNSFNMVMSGVNPAKILPYYKDATKLINKADDLIKKANLGKLVGKELDEFAQLKEFYSAGFADAFTRGQGMEAIKQGRKSISQVSLNFNNRVDSMNRMALLMYAKDNPNYIKQLGKTDAVEAVRHVLFDPSNLSDLEANTIRRIIPFYTFTKQNLMFQANSVMKNTPKYNKLFKGFNKLYDSLPDNSYYDYQKDNMQIPLPWSDENGNQMFLKANLPLSDLGEFMSNPFKRTVSSLSPVISTPFELITGIDTYTGEESYNSDLQKGLNKLGINKPGINNAADAVETILTNFGIKNPTINLVKKINAIISGINGDSDPQQVWAEIFRSVLQNTNEENIELSKMYDDLEVYQAAVKQLKEQGIDVPTIRDITSSNNIKLNNIKRKRTRL